LAILGDHLAILGRNLAILGGWRAEAVERRKWTVRRIGTWTTDGVTDWPTLGNGSGPRPAKMAKLFAKVAK
jgi:hypothetical protein